jgi:pyridoxal/pyridoxine/pyridoxamine kinase
MPVAAFKLGMLGSVEAISAIAEVISDYPDIPVVLDPVLASGRGDQFADEEMIEAMIGLLLPQTTLLTPNSLEARRLTQQLGEADGDARHERSLAGCAHSLIDAGCEYVLVTGTHEAGLQVVNTLYGSHGTVRTDRWDRSARQLPRFRLHPGFGHRGTPGQRGGCGGRGDGGAGIYLAHPGGRFSAGHGTIHSRSPVLVAGRG